MTNQDQLAGDQRLAPRAISRPPVDPSEQRAFGRPTGVDGSFVGLDNYRDQGDYTPQDQAPDPVLAEAFGRPDRGGDSLQRHPADAGAMEAERAGDTGDDREDPWRDPAAAAALGTPALPKPPAPPSIVSLPVVAPLPPFRKSFPAPPLMTYR